MSTIAIVSPGAMGSALGRCWAAGGHRVVATVAGRSARTRDLAVGLDLVADLDAAVGAADLVIVICPPAQAAAALDDVLASAARTGARPLLLEANALAPETVAVLARRAEAAGLELVDGAVSGGPPDPGDVREDAPEGTTMLFLSGPRAAEVAALPRVGFRVRTVGFTAGQASGVKMCTASVHKGTTALWLQALQTARALGVAEVVLDDLAEADPVRAARLPAGLAVGASKSARFVAEMEEIARTQASAGAGAELFTAMAGVWERVSRSDLASLTPEQARAQTDLADVLRRLAATTDG